MFLRSNGQYFFALLEGNVWRAGQGGASKQDKLVLFSLSAQLFSLSFERGHSFVVGGRAAVVLGRCGGGGGRCT